MPLAATGNGSGASSLPAGISPEIEKYINDRVAGLQRVIAQKDTAIQSYEARIREAEESGLTPDERLTRAQERLAEENRQLKAKLELAEMASEYGDVLPVYQELLGASTAKDQLDLLKKLRAPAPAAGTEDVIEVPDIDMNNPRRPSIGTEMTDELADRILGGIAYQAEVTQRGARSSSTSGSEV